MYTSTSPTLHWNSRRETYWEYTNQQKFLVEWNYIIRHLMGPVTTGRKIKSIQLTFRPSQYVMNIPLLLWNINRCNSYHTSDNNSNQHNTLFVNQIIASAVEVTVNVQFFKFRASCLTNICLSRDICCCYFDYHCSSDHCSRDDHMLLSEECKL